MVLFWCPSGGEGNDGSLTTALAHLLIHQWPKMAHSLSDVVLGARLVGVAFCGKTHSPPIKLHSLRWLRLSGKCLPRSPSLIVKKRIWPSPSAFPVEIQSSSELQDLRTAGENVGLSIVQGSWHRIINGMFYEFMPCLYATCTRPYRALIFKDHVFFTPRVFDAAISSIPLMHAKPSVQVY